MLVRMELTQDFTLLNHQFKELVAALLGEVDLPPVRVEVEATSAGNFRGFDSGKFYVVQSGSVTARYRGRMVYMLDEGDILLQDVAGAGNPELAVSFGSEAGASLHSYSALEFMQRVFDNKAAIKLWTRILITYSGMMLRLTASRSDFDVVATPGFELYQPGDTIIQQGERADYVFNMTSGSADVLVDDVPVGRISEGEIFGAMAALTHADRSATVKARTPCSVVKVPKEQFTDLIKTNPTTIHSLLIDMANSIVNLNEQLVGMRRNDDKGQSGRR